MIKVLDLFSGTQSVRKALDQKGTSYEYYGIDIYSPEEKNIILDLSQNNIVEKVVAALPKDWKPDFIWASPVCNKFSLASAVKGGNIYFEKTPLGVKVREDFAPLQSSVYKNMDPKLIKEDAVLHIKLVNNMQKIIDNYSCDFVIENPQSSYIKYILSPLYVRNHVNYCMYGFPQKKSTTIYSNKHLIFKRCQHKYHETKIGTLRKNNKKSISKYTDRSAVPPALVIDILNKMEVTIK